jgi:CheY-like chemotaxis protein
MRVIFVEDDALNRRVVGDMLKVIGIDMAEAEDGETGLRMISENAYDLVLMDLRMPGMDGLTAIRLLRDMPTPLGQIPVIVVTADTATDLKERCHNAGANDVILKPVALNALIDAIGRVAASSLDDDILLD